MRRNFGLIGTITHDVITYESGSKFEGLGGILYQAAVLCGLKKEVFLYTNLGQELVQDVEKIIEKWPTLQRQGIRYVPGSGNNVHLYYPEKGERVEVLESVVPPLDPSQVIRDLEELRMLILVLNSGFDIEFEDFRKIKERADCPVWLDIHSLPLDKKLNVSRKYIHLREWKEWANGVHYLQANKKEMASMLGHLDNMPSEGEIEDLGKTAFKVGVKAVFITLGKEGVLVLTPDKSEKIASIESGIIVDTTGCGDVFCAGTVMGLAEGHDPFKAASFGLNLAAKAVGITGIEETYRSVRLLIG